MKKYVVMICNQLLLLLLLCAVLSITAMCSLYARLQRTARKKEGRTCWGHTAETDRTTRPVFTTCKILLLLLLLLQVNSAGITVMITLQL